VRLEKGQYGRRAVLTSAWSPDLLAFFREETITELELNYAKGWQGDGISFIQELTELKWFRITDWRISSVAPIHSLHVVQLNTDVALGRHSRVHFSRLGNSENLISLRQPVIAAGTPAASPTW